MPPSRKKKVVSTTPTGDAVATTTPPLEKRLCRYRESCPQALQERLYRATTQRMYLIHHQLVVPVQQHNASSTITPSVASMPSTTATTANVNDENSRTNDAPFCARCDFTVLGSTGNVYTVQLKHVPSCNCPDYERRQDCCKHIIFVLLKVIGLSASDPLAYQKAYVTCELQELIQRMQQRRVGGGSRRGSNSNNRGDDDVLANEAVQANYFAALERQTKGKNDSSDAADDDEKDDGFAKRRSLDNEEDCDCPVCFDKMDINASSQKLTYCRASCGTNFHVDCIRRWLQNCTSKSCPNCRQRWIGENDIANSNKKQENPYINLASLQGMSQVQDTSTYYDRWSPPRRQKRRRW